MPNKTPKLPPIGEKMRELFYEHSIYYSKSICTMIDLKEEYLRKNPGAELYDQGMMEYVFRGLDGLKRRKINS